MDGGALAQKRELAGVVPDHLSPLCQLEKYDRGERRRRAEGYNERLYAMNQVTGGFARRRPIVDRALEEDDVVIAEAGCGGRALELAEAPSG